MTELIRYVVEQFAEHPDMVEYKTEERGNSVNVTVYLAEDDMGKVIGRQGKIAKAFRALVKAATPRGGKRYNIEIKGKTE